MRIDSDFVSPRYRGSSGFISGLMFGAFLGIVLGKVLWNWIAG